MSSGRRVRRSTVLLAVAIVLSLTLGGLGMNIIQKSDGQSSGSTTPVTQQWLNQELASLKPTQNVSVPMGVVYPRASYGNLVTSYNNLAVEQADLTMLLSTNVQCVRIDIGYGPWLQNNQTAINEMTSLVQQIRAAGKCLIIADAASETYRGAGQLTWSQFESAWPQRVSTLASLYKPDYYLVIKEPGWYVPLISDAATNTNFQNLSTWLSLTRTLISSVQSVSPDTKIGVSIAADSLNGVNAQGYVSFLNGLQQIPDLSVIGFDIYTESGFVATQNYLSANGSGGKAIWIAEAWSGDATVAYDASRAQLDTEWMQVLYYFAQHIGASMVIPFYTDLLASYSLSGTSPTTPSQIVSLYQQRTPVFYEFQKVIASGGGTPASSSSSSGPSSSSSSSAASSSASVTATTSSTTPATVSSTKSGETATTSSAGGLVSVNQSSATTIGQSTTATTTTEGHGSGTKTTLLIAGIAVIAIVAVGAVFYLRARKR